MTGETAEKCCVCGRILPNRYAVAGRCAADGCQAAFCAMHWRPGGRLCPSHESGGENEKTKGKDDKDMSITAEEREMCARADASLSGEKKASIFSQIGEFAVKFGQGAGALAKKLAGIRSTDEALAEIDLRLAEARARREPLSKRHGELYNEIVAKKKVYQAAAPAKRRILEMELKAAVAEFQSLERQIAAYLHNETVLTKVRGRMCELVAMNLKSVSEKGIDELADKIDEAAATFENIDGAISDLDKAGVVREREDAAFEDALAAFDEPMPDIASESATNVSPDLEPPQ